MIPNVEKIIKDIDYIYLFIKGGNEVKEDERITIMVHSELTSTEEIKVDLDTNAGEWGDYELDNKIEVKTKKEEVSKVQLSDNFVFIHSLKQIHFIEIVKGLNNHINLENW
jgi:hypothetical protein